MLQSNCSDPLANAPKTGCKGTRFALPETVKPDALRALCKVLAAYRHMSQVSDHAARTGCGMVGASWGSAWPVLRSLTD